MVEIFELSRLKKCALETGPLWPQLLLSRVKGPEWHPQVTLGKNHFTRRGQFPPGKPQFLVPSLLRDVSCCFPKSVGGQSVVSRSQNLRDPMGCLNIHLSAFLHNHPAHLPHISKARAVYNESRVTRAVLPAIPHSWTPLPLY